MKLSKFLGLVLVILAIGRTSQTTCNNYEHSTECELNNGTIVCCPIKEASCCATGNNCCPKGFECDVENGRCIKNSLFIPFHLSYEKLEVRKNVICPDNLSACPAKTTCCQQDDGSYGCCPIPNAVCCNDHIHCCPEGFKCDTKDGHCIKGDLLIEIFKKTKSMRNVVCPDKQSECPTGSTCCLLDDGNYGCCPIPNAVCCSDHIHCCPEGYTCDSKDGRCNKGDVSLPFYNKIKSIPSKSLDHIICPDGLATCPSDATCCQMASGQFACCPVPKANCCEDQLHCCPHGYKCDLANGKCNNGFISVELLKKFDSKPIESAKTKNVSVSIRCSKHKICAPDSTCCILPNGVQGCCPLKNAVCCSDERHCCPEGFKCDMKERRCYQGQIKIPFYPKTVALDSEETQLQEHKSPFNKITSVVCPDGCSFCPKGATCCPMFDGSYGCCPLPEAICCSDKTHCCPKGSKCNLAEGTCETSSAYEIQWFQKEKAQKFEPNAEELTILMSPLICRDNTTCDARATCCLQEDNSYGCCPYANGVCCPGSAFCCPENNSCGKNPGECVPNKLLNTPYLNWHRIEVKAKHFIENLIEKTVQTPEACAKGTQCTKSDGSLDCCPYVNGTCCGSDGYCCPNDYRCDASIESCTLIDPDNTRKVEPIQSKVTFDTCAEESKCSIPKGGFGCCPYKNGTCCGSNGLCCPHKYTCNEEDQSCLLPSESNTNIEPIPIKENLILKKSSKRRIKLFQQPRSVQCDDSIHFCPDTYSCCPKNPSGNGDVEYGCCPVVDAVCCDDGINCCPKGYECTKDSLTTCRRKRD